MKVTKACPTWQPENMFEKLNCVSFILPCEVFLVSTVLLSHTELKNLMNIIATEEVVFLRRKRLREKSNFTKSFESQNTVTNRPCEACCQTLRHSLYCSTYLVGVSLTFRKKIFLVEDFITDRKLSL